MEHVQHNAPWGQKSARAVGGQPAPLPEVAGWQEGMQWRTVEQMIDVQILDAPVPQMVDNVMASFRLLDKPIAEQVVAVPKISCPSSCPSRAFLRVPQVVEQLVEVPTVLSDRGADRRHSSSSWSWSRFSPRTEFNSVAFFWQTHF